ncbi:hypothetical protein ACFLZM_02495 [Thermodesulfobacteriota bacterium]
MFFFQKKKNSVGDNEDFVTLMRVAQENDEVRTRLLQLLSLDDFNRKSALNTWLDDIRLKGAPKELVSAIACLTDNGVAQKAFDILSP